MGRRNRQSRPLTGAVRGDGGTLSPAAPSPAPMPPAPRSPAPLRGADAVDEALVREAITEINRVSKQAGLASSIAIGRAVLRLFGGGTPAEFLSGEKEHASWRALEARYKELQVSYSHLRNCVAVLDQLERLPPHVGQALSPTQHTRLLSVESDETRLALAEKAIAEGLTDEQFLPVVKEAKIRDGQKAQGRPPVPAFVKSLERSCSAAEALDLGQITAAAVEALGAEKAAKLRERIQGAIAALQQASGRLDEALQANERA